MTSPAFSLPKKGTERQITSWSQLHKFRPLRQNGDEWSVSAFSDAALDRSAKRFASSSLAARTHLPLWRPLLYYLSNDEAELDTWARWGKFARGEGIETLSGYCIKGPYGYMGTGASNSPVATAARPICHRGETA